MTILAGIFSRCKDNPIKESGCEALERAISRNPDDEIIVFRDTQSFLAKVDINAYNQPAFRVGPAGSVSMLAGEPLLALSDGNSLRTRTHDLDMLHQEWDRGDWDLLTKTQGVFCAVHYQPTVGKLILIADKLGIRPLYYWAGDKYVVFATALRVLEDLAEVPKQMDMQALSEMTCFGFPLGNRTPYFSIAVLKAAEIVQISEKSISRSQYSRWDQIQLSSRSEPELLREAYERFTSAVTRRLRRDTTTVAFLSGGLDSRCIVSILRSRNVVVHTFNFARPGMQDQVFGAECARQVGTFHEEVPMNPEVDPDWSMMMAAAWGAAKHRSTWPADRPRLVWSGDGGSVGVGHVYMSRPVVDLLRAGKRDVAIDVFLHQAKVGARRRYLKSNIAAALSGIPKDGIREELDDIHCEDPARGFHVFLMLNDQRRHLSGHFENIDLHRLEFHLPFYDSNFLQLILSSPIDLCLSHGFYTEWLTHFPPVTTSVPWQTYPGHEPCGLPIPKGLSYQWDSARSHALRNLQKRRLLQLADEMLKANHFPYQIMNKGYLRLATCIYRVGLRDYGYLINIVRTYFKYWALCGGNYVLRSPVE